MSLASRVRAVQRWRGAATYTGASFLQVLLLVFRRKTAGWCHICAKLYIFMVYLLEVGLLFVPVEETRHCKSAFSCRKLEEISVHIRIYNAAVSTFMLDRMVRILIEK